MKSARRGRIWLAAAALSLAVALAFAFRGPLLRAAVAAALDIATGSQVAFDSLELAPGRAIAQGVRLRRGGVTLLTVRRLAVTFDLRDLLPGAAQRGAIRSADVDGAAVTLARRPDGSFVPFAVGGGGGGGAGGGVQAPMRFTLAVRDSRAEVSDPSRIAPGSRRIEIDGIDVNGNVDTGAETRLRARGVLRTAGSAEQFPVAFQGRSDARRSFALYRLTAARLPLPDLANFAINRASARVQAGEAHGLDVRIYSLDYGEPKSAFHIAGRVLLGSVRLTVPGLALPLQDLGGTLDAFDGGVGASDLRGTLAGFPIDATGAVYDWSDPAFRLAVRADGTLEQARDLFAFSTRLPIRGRFSARTVVEGPVGNPMVAARFDAPEAVYDRFPLEGATGDAVYYDGALALAPVTARYGPLDAEVRGLLDFNTPAASRLVVEASAPAGTLPYVAQAVPGVPLRATALMTGTVPLDARGVFDGAGEGESLAGLFAIDRRGDGKIGPLRATRPGGAELSGAYYQNRSASRSSFWLTAHDFALDRRDPPPALPGLPALAPPQVDGTFDVAVAGEGPPSNFSLAGSLAGREMSAGSVHVTAFSTLVAGSFGDARLGEVHADGPWGEFSGNGDAVGGGLALRGQYRGSFERLATLTGDLGARGAVDAPVALMVGQSATVIQTAGIASAGMTVRGVPVGRLSGTLAIAGKRIEVYGASAELAGGLAVARGTYGGGGDLSVWVAGADAARLRGAGVPLQAGSIDAIGTVRDDAGKPHFDGSVALTGGRSGRFHIAANGGVSADVARIDLSDSQTLFESAYGRVAGSIRDVASGRPDYTLDVSARDVQADPFLHYFIAKPPYVRATVSGSFLASGRVGTLPHVAGDVSIPEGNFNGQAFRAGSAHVELGAGELTARDGHVVVGSTSVAFGAQVQGRDAAVDLAAPSADLRDFDDLFDTGDTLGGRGRVTGTFQRRGREVHTTGDIAIAGLRYRLFDLGDATSTWSSAGDRVTGGVRVGGASGRLDVDGNLTLPPQAPLDKLLVRSHFTGAGTLASLDLGVWLPVLGYQLPIGGRIDAKATLSGSIGNPTIAANAQLVGGNLGKFTVNGASASFVAGIHGAQITSASVDLASLVLTASGHLGFGAKDPLQLALHATTPNIGALATKYLGTTFAPTGTAEADLRVEGTRAVPSVNGGLDVENASFGGLLVPSALGQFTLRGRAVVVSGAEVNFAKGRLLFAGSVPFTIQPFAFGPAEAPMGLELTADAIDLTDLTPLLAKDSTLSGRLDGHVAVGGTAGAPQLHGDLELSGGRLESPLENAPITNLAAQLNFDGNTIALASLRAQTGTGTFEASGSATVPDLVRPGLDATYALRGKASAFQLDFPALGRGQIDGTFSLTHAPGAPPSLDAQATLSNAIIPFSALLLASAGGGGPALAVSSETAPQRPDVALAVKVTAGDNVRVRSSNIDIGGKGTLALDGTLRAPVLSGTIASTGGTLAYFNRLFRVQSGTVVFRPSQGVIPNLDAVAIATVDNPDPDTVRNPTGTADVTVTVSGSATSPNIQLSSNPQYDREQILGLLLNAPAIGVTNMFATQTPGQPLTLANSPTANRSGQTALGQEAFGVINAQFTRALLAPLETAFGGALGLSNFAVNINYSGVGLSARKILGKNVDFIYATSFNYPYRQTFGFDIKPNPTTAAQVTVFQSFGVSSFGANGYSINPLAPQNPRATAAQPSTGTAGFSLSLQRLYP